MKELNKTLTLNSQCDGKKAPDSKRYNMTYTLSNIVPYTRNTTNSNQ